MTTITFDTLKLVDRLKAAGISPEQAEAMVRVVAEAQDELVTKRDLERLEASMKLEMQRLSGDMTLVKWMLGIVIAAEVIPLARALLT
jgi:hypothetical protein